MARRVSSEPWSTDFVIEEPEFGPFVRSSTEPSSTGLDGREMHRFGETFIGVVRDPAVGISVTRKWMRPGQSEMVMYSDTRPAFSALTSFYIDNTILQVLESLDNGTLPFAWQSEHEGFVGLKEMSNGEAPGRYQAQWIYNRFESVPPAGRLLWRTEGRPEPLPDFDQESEENRMGWGLAIRKD